MEFVEGTNLSDIWFDLGEGDIVSVTRQLAKLESKMMYIDCVPGWWKPVLCKRLGESGREARHPTRGRAFLRWFRYKTAFVVWQEITARRRSRTMSATLCLFYYSLKRTDNYRRKCRGCARKRGRQGTSLSRAVRSTAVAVPAHAEERLPAPGAAAVGS